MSFKSILANLNEIANNQAVIITATTLAREFNASLTGLYVVPAARICPAASYEPIPELFEAQRKYFDRQIQTVTSAFNAAVTERYVRSQIRIDDSPSPLICDDVIEQGLISDLLVLSKTDMHSKLGVELDFVPRVVMAVGRSVLVLPHNSALEFVPETVIVGWNGSREAARAIFDGLPFLKCANKVHVIWVESPAKQRSADSMPCERVVRSLMRHGVKAIADPVSDGGDRAGEVLLQRVAEIRADLLIVGAYGHSRLHEMVLGGATRTVLREMTCPVLLSH